VLDFSTNDIESNLNNSDSSISNNSNDFDESDECIIEDKEYTKTFRATSLHSIHKAKHNRHSATTLHQFIISIQRYNANNIFFKYFMKKCKEIIDVALKRCIVVSLYRCIVVTL
jgi:hypothetical protein